MLRPIEYYFAELHDMKCFIGTFLRRRIRTSWNRTKRDKYGRGTRYTKIIYINGFHLMHLDAVKRSKNVHVKYDDINSTYHLTYMTHKFKVTDSTQYKIKIKIKNNKIQLVDYENYRTVGVHRTANYTFSTGTDFIEIRENF